MNYDEISLTLNVEDPQSTSMVENAYCVLSEAHLNYELNVVAAVFKCWRNKEAHAANRVAFNAIQVQFPADNGGKLILEQLEAKLPFGNVLRDCCLAQNLGTSRPTLPATVPAAADVPVAG